MSYFDLFPKELNIIILSYLYLDSKIKSNKIKKLLSIFNIKLNDTRLILQLVYPEYIETSKDELVQIHGNQSLKLLSTLFLLKRDPYVSTINKNELHISKLLPYYNIIYRTELKKQNPKLYQLMKEFNLSTGGKHGVINFVELIRPGVIWDLPVRNETDYLGWKGLYYRLNHIEDRDFLSDTMHNFLNTGDIPIDYVFEDSNETPIAHHSYINYLFYSLALNPKFKFALQSPIRLFYFLMSAYWYNEDIYNKMKDKMTKEDYIRMIDDEEVLEEIRNMRLEYQETQDLILAGEANESQLNSDDINFIEEMEELSKIE